MLDKLPITKISKKSLATTQKKSVPVQHSDSAVLIQHPEPKNKKPLQNINHSKEINKKLMEWFQNTITPEEARKKISKSLAKLHPNFYLNQKLKQNSITSQSAKKKVVKHLAKINPNLNIQ